MPAAPALAAPAPFAHMLDEPEEAKLRSLDTARAARLLAWDRLHAALARHRRAPTPLTRAGVRHAVAAYRAAFARHREANAALDAAANTERFGEVAA